MRLSASHEWPILTAIPRPPYNGKGSGYNEVAMDDVQDRV